METSLRVVLLLVGIFILAGIIWDIRRAKFNAKLSERNKSKSKTPMKSSYQNADSDHDNFSDDFEEVILVQKPKKYRADVPQELSDKEPLRNNTQSREEPDLDISLDSDYSGAPIILTVMARQPGILHGKKLVEAFRDTNLYFGDMNMFHYHENTDGSGEIMFSVISAIEPGVFELSTMESMKTPAISLFFVPTRPNQAIAAFELMLRIAKQLAQKLDGEIRDHERKILTQQSLDKYREAVRSFGYHQTKMVG